MKKSLFMFLLTIVTLLAASSCREKTTGEKIEDGIEETVDEVEDAAEDVGDEIEDAVDDN